MKPKFLHHAIGHDPKGPLAARFAAVQVGDGATFSNNRHLPGNAAWLVGEWRAQVLPQQSAATDIAAHSCCGHQGALSLPTNTPAAEAGTGPRPLRGPLLNRIAPTRAADLHRLSLPAASSLRRTSLDGVGEKCYPAFRTTTIAEPAQRAPCGHKPAVPNIRYSSSMSSLRTSLPAFS
jgi:hypothetical protein